MEFQYLLHYPYFFIPFLPSLLSLILSSIVIVTYARMRPRYSLLYYAFYQAIAEQISTLLLIINMVVFFLVVDDVIDWSFGDSPTQVFFAVSLPLYLASVLASWLWTVFLVWYGYTPVREQNAWKVHFLNWWLPTALYTGLTLIAIYAPKMHSGESCQGLMFDVCATYPIGVVIWIFVLIAVAGVMLKRKENVYTMSPYQLLGTFPVDDEFAQFKMNRKLTLQYGFIYLIIVGLVILALIVRMIEPSWRNLRIIFYFIAVCLLPFRGILNALAFLTTPGVKFYLRYMSATGHGN